MDPARGYYGYLSIVLQVWPKIKIRDELTYNLLCENRKQSIKKLILVLLPYSEASEDLVEESRFMLYPTITLPDSDGKYFISYVGFDYLYYPVSVDYF